MTLQICPEDVLLVLLPAKAIPPSATVSKRYGEQTFTLAQTLKVYREPISGEKQSPIEIAGIFLIGPRGGINQISPEALLHWHIDAESLVDELQLALEGPEQ